jgi:integrase
MDMTDAKLAEKSGLEIRTVRKVLSGKSVKHTSALAVSKALNVKVDNVFHVNGELAPLSDQTVKHHHRLISSMLTTAVQWQLILNNPATRVKPPKVEHKEASHFDEDTTELMLGLLEKEPLKYKAMIYVTVYTGCRLGELAGLEWSDVSFENKLIRIRQASQYLPGKGTFTKTPKNETSARVISMPEILCGILKEYKSWWNQQKLLHGDLWDKDSDRLFVQWNGKPIHPSTPTKWFKAFRERNNLPELNFHGLRHTNASLLISNNVDVQTVAKRLGHSKATTTTSIYSHFLRKPDVEAAEKLDNLFTKNKKQTIRNQV